MTKTIKLSIFLQLSIAVTFLSDLYNVTTLGNLSSLVLIVFGFLRYGKISISLIPLFITYTALILYVINPGNLKIGVSLLPFIGFFFKPIHLPKENLIIAQLISLLNILFIHIIGHIGYGYFGINSINTQSQLYLYVLIVNILLFNKPFVSSVIFSVILAALFNPGRIGNRSSIFLVLFLLNNKNLKNICNSFKKNRHWLRKILFGMLVLGFSIITGTWLINHPKFESGGFISDIRFIWFADMFNYLLNNGMANLIDNASRVFVDEVYANPHNSFFYMLFHEAWVGALKTTLFFISVVFIPFSSWLAIFCRASLDSFFFVASLGILFASLMRVRFDIFCTLLKNLWFLKKRKIIIVQKNNYFLRIQNFL
jgi:hypothetical protein